MTDSDDPWNSFYHLAGENPQEIDVDLCPSYNFLMGLEERYEGEEHLASGGMKKITKAFDLKNSRTVAIARPLPDIPKESYDAFIREAQLTSHLDHPNIIKVFDLGIDENKFPYFTMELKVGDNLKQHISKQHLSEADEQEYHRCLRDNLEIFIKVCDAIAYSHSVNVIHLDLKPANIQVGAFGEVLVCDWGLGKLIGDFGEFESAESTFRPDMINELTHYGEIKGTPGYMAPEQVQPNLKKDPLTDIYALGGILYYILCQANPIKGSLTEVVEKTKNHDLLFPIDRCPEFPIPKSLDAVVRKAMSLRPQDRYSNVEQLRKEVYQYLRGFATQAEGASFKRQFALLYQRNKGTFIAIGSVFALFLILITSFILIINAGKLEAERALHKAEEAIAMYEAEKEAKENLNENFNKELELFGEFFIQDLSYYNNPIQALAQSESKWLKLLKKNEKNEKAWLNLGYIYFLRQEFNKATRYLSQVLHLEESMTLMLVSENYRKIKSQDNKLLKSHELIDLANQFKPFDGISFDPYYRRMLLVRMLAYDYLNRKDFYGYDEVLKTYIKFYNPDSIQIESLNYRTKEGYLSLRGKVDEWGIEDEGFKLCLFQIFPIEHLDLQSSGLSNLEYIALLNVKKLDIRNNEIKDLTPIATMSHLKELIVGIGQFSTEELLKVPAKIKVNQVNSN